MRRNKALVTLLSAFIFFGAILDVTATEVEDGESIEEIEDDVELTRQNTNTTESGILGGIFVGRRPCTCKDTGCICCTRTIFPLPPIIRQRTCMNLTYQENQPNMNMSITLNRKVVFNNTIKGRNPEPICVSPLLLSRAEICVYLTEVYLRNRNMHACLKVEGQYNKRVLFKRTMGCMYVGQNGFAILRPENEEPNPDDDNGDLDPVSEGNTNNPSTEGPGGQGNSLSPNATTGADNSPSTQAADSSSTNAPTTTARTTQRRKGSPSNEV